MLTRYAYNDVELDELGIQIGLLQVMKGLAFIHSNLMVHLCLQPDAIFIGKVEAAYKG
jgi:hypothetical protein